jgi:hypothetical protein
MLQEIIDLTDAFCRAHLDEEYRLLCRKLAAMLDELEPSPFQRGRVETWACGITYALGSINFLFDPSFEPHLTASRLCELYNVSRSSGSARSRQIIDLLGLTPFHPELSTSFMEQSNPLPLLTTDAPDMASEEENPLERYMEMFKQVSALHDELFMKLERDEIIAAAKRLGIWGDGKIELTSSEGEAIFADHALYTSRRNGRTLIDQALEDLPADADPDRRNALEAMQSAIYSVFEVPDAPISGVLLARDLLNQVIVPVIDITIAAQVVPGMIFASRVLPFPSFAMLSGAPMAIDQTTVDLIEREVNASIPSDTITDLMTPEQRIALEAAIIRACLRG